MKWQAYNPRQIQDGGKWYALCIVEAPNGITHDEWQYGTSQLNAQTALANLIRFRYGCGITQERVS